MNNYYAVVRSTDHLMHYGIKGMKWGVRKAIEKGNSKKLARQYKKAAKKFAKLEKRADIEQQAKNVKKYKRVAGVGAAVAGAGIGGVVGSSLRMKNILGKSRSLAEAHKANLDEANKQLSAAIRDGERRLKLTAQGGKYNSYRHPYERDMAFDKVKKTFNDRADKIREETRIKNDALKKQLDDNSRRMDAQSAIGKASKAVGAAGLLASTIAGGKAVAAKYRTTEKGHAKAVSERDAWKREMNKAFKGTKYAGQYSVPTKSKKKRSR